MTLAKGLSSKRLSILWTIMIHYSAQHSNSTPNNISLLVLLLQGHFLLRVFGLFLLN